MANAWLYQMVTDWAADWTPADYRAHVHEGDPFPFQIRGTVLHRGFGPPRPGDVVFFLFCKKDNDEPGIYGVGEIVACDEELVVVTEAPSDRLKMEPLWDADTQGWIAQIRGPEPRGFTMFIVGDNLERRLRSQIARWVEE